MLYRCENWGSAKIGAKRWILGRREVRRIFQFFTADYAHKNNVIHRDMKPANIMMAGPGKAMVMDFGLASELRDGLTRVTHPTGLR